MWILIWLWHYFSSKFVLHYNASKSTAAITQEHVYNFAKHKNCYTSSSEGKYKQMANESTRFKTDNSYHAAKQLCSMISGCCQHFCQKIVMLLSHNQVTNWRPGLGGGKKDTN